MLVRHVVSFNVLSCLVLLLSLFSVVQSEKVSGALKRQSLIYHEPPFEKNHERADQVSEHYITQRLDHFDHQNKVTFQMRYLQNAQHFKSGGPIFIFIGGEWQISSGHILSGQHIYDLTKEFDGLLLYTEHRYYGKSFPTKTVSTADLKYLTVEQSLADLAHFVKEITNDKQLNATGGVIIVGGSYSATMAVWFRQKYPHLVNGAWASSAPLHAKLNYSEYTEAVGKSIRKVGGNDCYYKIEDIFQAIDDLITNDDFGTLQKLFQVCENGFNITNQYDVWNFYASLKNIFSGVVQGHRTGIIEYYCKRLSTEFTNPTNDIENHELYPFALLFRQIFVPNVDSCISMDYESDIKILKQDNTTLAFNFRPWFYQTCSEFGWYQTTDSETQPFGKLSPIEFYMKLCRDIFGDVFKNATVLENNIQHTNVFYGGFKPAVTNVYFTHGALDPWHRMGVLKDLNRHSPATVIPGISHCRDLGSISYKYDSKPLINSKVTIRNLVKKWLTF